MVQELHDAPAPPAVSAGTMKFNWGRLVFSILFLAAIFGAGMYTAHDPVPDVKDWSKELLHAFGILLGAVIGLITGEAVANH
jgi:hypothetical protein